MIHILSKDETRKMISIYEEMRDSHPKVSRAYDALNYRIEEHRQRLQEL